MARLSDIAAPAGRKTGFAALLAALFSAMCAGAAQGQDAPRPVPYRSGANGLIYPVQKDETLSAIAARFTGRAAHWRTLGRLNRIRDDKAIPVGTEILIPAALLPLEPATARIAAVSGEVDIRRPDGSAASRKIDAAAGTVLSEGDTIATGRTGFVSLQLDDGTRFTLQPESSATLRVLRATAHLGRPTTRLFLHRGRIESRVTPAQDGRRSFDVQSPLAVSSVRGTAFRVGAQAERTVNEVLAGTVAVAAAEGGTQRLLARGLGAVVTAGRVGQPTALLAAPALADGYQRQEALPLRFLLAHPVAAGFHAQISRDAAGADLVDAAKASAVDGSGILKLADLPDGMYYIHYSAIDGGGLQGLEDARPFQLKARPFPPLLMQDAARFQGGRPGEDATVTMAWAQQDGIAGYRIQLAGDPGFSAPLLDRSLPPGESRHLASLPAGVYYWRVASLAHTAGMPDQGPFGAPARIEVLPARPAPEVAQDETETRFSWSGSEGQQFEFQLSVSPAFDILLAGMRLDSPSVRLPALAPGRYYARVRSMDADGFTGTFSPPQNFVVPLRWRAGDGSLWRAAAEAVGTGAEP